VERTIDHSGLLTDFVSGVDDFDTYLAGNPLHQLGYLNAEWFSASPHDNATVVYDLGALYSISRMAYWNEDSNGVSNVSVFACSDSTCTVPLPLGSFIPTHHLIVDYPADVFSLTAAVTRYVRMDFTEYDDTNWIAVGELAFDAGPGVPEPSSLGLIAAGLGLIAWRRSRG
jgi:hypothetical protein